MSVKHPYLCGVYMTRHHLIPRERDRRKKYVNFTTHIWSYKHQHWHKVFGNDDIFEIIGTLSSLRPYELRGHLASSWKVVFKKMTFMEARNLLQRLVHIKEKSF